ncbi:MAG: hypothetical protein R6V44_03195 [Paracoccaceae bacterium]
MQAVLRVVARRADRRCGPVETGGAPAAPRLARSVFALAPIRAKPAARLAATAEARVTEVRPVDSAAPGGSR